MFDKIKDIYKDQADDVFIPLTAGIDASLLGMFEINKKGEVKRISDGRILKVTPRKDYPTVYLRKDGRKISYKIHLLLARTFIENPDPDTHVEVDHIDRNSGNYSLGNLRWVTRSENKVNRVFKENSHKRYDWWVSPDKKEISKVDPKDSTWKHYYTNEADLFDRFEFPKDWKVVPGTNGKIFCSSTGLILFTERTNYITAGYTNFAGYKTANIKGKNVKIHRLVYSLFSGDSDIDGFEIDHIDTNPQNNGIGNLRKVTPKENRNNPLSRQHSSKAVCQYDIKGNFIKEFSSCKEAYKALGRDAESSSGISKCCKGGSESFEGFKWKYKDENNTDI